MLPNPSPSFLLRLTSEQVLCDLQELRGGEDDPCKGFVDLAVVLRGPSAVIVGRAMNAASVVFLTGLGIPLPIGTLAGDLMGRVARWAFTPDERPDEKAFDARVRTLLADVIEACDVILCAEQNRLGDCKVARTGDPDSQIRILRTCLETLERTLRIIHPEESVERLVEDAGLKQHVDAAHERARRRLLEARARQYAAAEALEVERQRERERELEHEHERLREAAAQAERKPVRHRIRE